MSTIGIISDIHGNIDALDQVIESMASEGVTRYFSCGDVVGYGKQPNECCSRLQQIDAQVVAGNHDWAVIGRTAYLDTFSRSAIDGIDYTRQVMDDDHYRWLESLPLYHREGHMEFVHATLHAPETWPYLAVGSILGESQWQDVQKCFDAMKGQVCFVGHSHRPAVFVRGNSGEIDVIEPANEEWIDLSGHKAVVDVGSVGLPRGSHKNVSAAVYRPDEFKLKLLKIAVS